MATPFVLKDCKVYIDGYDVSGNTNSASVTYEFPEVEATPFGSDVRFALPGIPDLAIDFAGFAETDGTDAVEDVLEAELGGTDIPMSVGYTGADGTPGFFTKVAELSRVLGGSVGEMYGFQARATSQGFKLIRGLYLAPNATYSGSGNGTARQIGAVSATQSVYGILHVFSAAGSSPTLDVVVASDDAGGFASGTTRLTFTQANDVTSEIQSAAGAITDDYWRAQWTLGGSSPEFEFAVLVGII